MQILYSDNFTEFIVAAHRQTIGPRLHTDHGFTTEPVLKRWGVLLRVLEGSRARATPWKVRKDSSIARHFLHMWITRTRGTGHGKIPVWSAAAPKTAMFSNSSLSEACPGRQRRIKTIHNTSVSAHPGLPGIDCRRTVKEGQGRNLIQCWMGNS